MEYHPAAKSNVMRVKSIETVVDEVSLSDTPTDPPPEHPIPSAAERNRESVVRTAVGKTCGLEIEALMGTTDQSMGEELAMRMSPRHLRSG